MSDVADYVHSREVHIAMRTMNALTARECYRVKYICDECESDLVGVPGEGPRPCNRCYMFCDHCDHFFYITLLREVYVGEGVTSLTVCKYCYYLYYDDNSPPEIKEPEVEG